MARVLIKGRDRPATMDPNEMRKAMDQMEKEVNDKLQKEREDMERKLQE
jgi:hypothetical protein